MAPRELRPYTNPYDLGEWGGEIIKWHSIKAINNKAPVDDVTGFHQN